jgi:TfoX/Sxy family transcriptional regulator of competence genes
VTQERWDEIVAGEVGGQVRRGTMFGSQGLRTGTKFFATWSGGRLVVKLPADRVEEVVGAGQAAPFEPMPGRPMRGWVVLEPTADWAALVAEARDFVESQNR